MTTNLFPNQEPKRPRKLVGPQADACRAWHDAWRHHRGCAFAWTDKDAALVAQALKLAGGDVALLAARAERLLSEVDDQWLARNAGPGVLVSHWNQLAYRPPTKPRIGTPFTYVPCPGPRIPPPAGLYEQFQRDRREAALRATAAPTTRRSPSSPAG